MARCSRPIEVERVLQPELLDALPAEDPRARRSRGDLRRINWLMNNAGLVAGALRKLPPPARVLDLGAGDGAFALRVARRLSWHQTEVHLVDRIGQWPEALRRNFEASGCAVRFWTCDVLVSFDELPAAEVGWANLFLHHFNGDELRRLLEEIASHCQIFVACEPRRSPFALLASRCLGLIGCNEVTRHDAVLSVRAGFRGNELTRSWPSLDDWSVTERAAGLFSHLFVARRS